jgi:lipoate-protein ligase A
MTRAPWHLWIDEKPRSGALNMALDLALMEQAARDNVAFVRLYRWTPFCLSFGCHEPALRRYDRATIEARGLDVVRRPTGGRAVWHARELTYAVATPDGLLGSLQEAYVRIHTALANAVRAFEVPATLAPSPGRAAGLGAGACFGAAAGGEVLVHGAKLVGSAQLRRDGGVLQHGSLLLADDQALVAELSGQPAPTGTTLEAAAGRSVSWEEVAAAFRVHALPALTPRWEPLHDPSPVVAAAARHAHFRDPAWSWRR